MVRLIGVIGSSTPSPEEYDCAEQVGRLIAERGFAVVCGGCQGVTEAASKGASAVGGLVVGLLPGGVEDANPYLTVGIPTGMGEIRNTLIVRSAEALIAIGGGYGTLSEIAFALKLNKQVIGLRTFEISREGRPVPGVVAAQTPEEAVGLALEQLRP